MRARLIKADGTTEPLDLPDGHEDHWLGRMLGTAQPESITLVSLAPGRPGLTLWHNPFALFTDQPRNELATKLAQWVAREPVPQYVSGDVILTGAIGSEGETHPLTQGQDRVLSEMLTRWARTGKTPVRTA